MKTRELPIKLEGILFTRVDDEIKYLVLHRRPEEGNFWQPLTGTLNSDESIIDCLYREIAEELGFGKMEVVGLTDEVYRFEWKRDDQTFLEFVYGVELSFEQNITLSNEHDEYKWCSFDEAISILGRDNNKKAFEAFQSKISV
jgi:dATP pyrophosphohydrolase